ncbi:right-handed parallel beta-helix repeat-containing protein [Flavicella sediminum]|uniref:right-handed parallel beta-helix repeat-containing protein n=1 Tax=Flavicella sediminum TaxID=2585141 RepID=UPI001123AF15|nr:right-handed parallel beta-helix repeat-containing protein [Flavicella sediminum]
MKSKSILILFLLVSINFLWANEFFVSTQGSNQNSGTKEFPFRTIQKAANSAISGDTITVREGTYREWVSPAHGGYHKSKPIVYRAAKGEKVHIKGSEIVKNWKKYKKNVWKTSVDNSVFGDFNPFATFVAGDWLLTANKFHLGEVYLNEKSLYETGGLDQLENPVAHKKAQDKAAAKLQWFAEVKDKVTIIYANFGKGVNPNKHLTEINVRPTCFFPKKTGVNYITVQGFYISQAATQWAPPTAEQIGAIGPHWSKGWVIENNNIRNSKCTGISIGKEFASGDNEFSKRKNLRGFHREIETVFKAIDLGWSKENIGSHTIHNNTIYECGQTGICGHMGAAFSTITNNKVYDINCKKMMFGAEVAGIKLHAPIDVLIAHNYVSNTYKAIWLDWQAQGTRVTGNLFTDNEWQDVFVEVSHGPTLIDNNIMLSHNSLTIGAHGVAAVHNLFGGTIRTLQITHRYTPYHYAHSTKLKGVAAIGGGDHRFYNNLFVSNENLTKGLDAYGLDAFNDYPVYYEGVFDTYTGKTAEGKKVTWFNYPVYMGQNIYFNKAIPYKNETGSVLTKQQAKVYLERNKGIVNLHLDIATAQLKKMKTQFVSTEKLGLTSISEASYENPDGSPILINTDFFGKIRTGQTPIAGPFNEIQEKSMKLFDLNSF